MSLARFALATSTITLFALGFMQSIEAKQQSAEFVINSNKPAMAGFTYKGKFYWTRMPVKEFVSSFGLPERSPVPRPDRILDYYSKGLRIVSNEGVITQYLFYVRPETPTYSTTGNAAIFKHFKPCIVRTNKGINASSSPESIMAVFAGVSSDDKIEGRPSNPNARLDYTLDRRPTRADRLIEGYSFKNGRLAEIAILDWRK